MKSPIISTLRRQAMWSLLLCALIPATAFAAEENSFLLGFKVRAGGRFDNVRMCVASSAGTKGGPAADVSLFAEIGLSRSMSLDLDLPFMRPILFGVAFKMLRKERRVGERRVEPDPHAPDWINADDLIIEILEVPGDDETASEATRISTARLDGDVHG